MRLVFSASLVLYALLVCAEAAHVKHEEFIDAETSQERSRRDVRGEVLNEPEPSTSDKVNIDEVEEMADVHLEETEEGHLKLQLRSHGKLHKLHLKENRKQLADVPINLLGMSEEKQDIIRTNLKGIKMMTDRKYQASIAVRKEGEAASVIQSGVFKLGKHEFTIDRHVNNRARVVKRYAERGIYKNDGVRVKELEKKASAMVDQVNAEVELVMIIDFSNWQRFENDIVRADGAADTQTDIFLYFAHLASMMDVAYAAMKNPDLNIRVSLAGMVVLTTPAELSQLVENIKVESGGETFVDPFLALDVLAEWLESSPPTSVLPPYDHVMIFTNYNLGEPGFSGILGLAFISAICNPIFSCSVVVTLQIHTFVADTATHELGHSLGAEHDGESASVECRDENFIMAAFAGQRPIIENRLLFTCCSQRSFWETLRTVNCTEITTASPNYPPAIDANVNAFEPGEVYDADDQCFITFNTSACDHTVLGRNICHNLFCVDPFDPTNCVTDFAPVSDGTECDVGKWCSKGECVPVGDFHITRDQGCNVKECIGGEKRCKNGVNLFDPRFGTCYPALAECDGFGECSDNSDEINCGPFSCPERFIKCTSGFNLHAGQFVAPRTCIPEEWYCDGAYVDCSDGSDEGDFCNGTLTTQPPAPPTTPVPFCDLKFTNDICGTILSPGFPSNYPNRVDCPWNITVPFEKVVEITFKEEVQLEDDLTCSFDSIKIDFDGFENEVNLCGTIPAGTIITSTTNSMEAVFSTDGSVNFPGFKFSFKAICPSPDSTTSDNCNGGSTRCAEVTKNQCDACDAIRITCCNACMQLDCNKRFCCAIRRKCKKAETPSEIAQCEASCQRQADMCGRECCPGFPPSCH